MKSSELVAGLWNRSEINCTQQDVSTTHAAGTGLNVPLLAKTLEHITAHPEEHDQTSYARRTACGTTYCFAGTAAVLAGRSIEWLSPASTCPGTWPGEAFDLTDGTDIADTARQLLGLSFAASRALFSDGNTIPDLWRIASELTGGEIEVPVGLTSDEAAR